MKKEIKTTATKTVQAVQPLALMGLKIIERRTSTRTGDAIWMKFKCGAGSRWTSTTEDYSGTICNFSGCNCGTKVKRVGETDDRYANWFGLRVAKATSKNIS